jgi:two-component system, LytTR family, response regulator
MSLRCAIVDDERLAREGLRIQLERSDTIDVEIIGEAASVEEAASLVKDGRLDLLFLDIRMPRQSGFELLAAQPVDRLPLIVFVTAYAEHAVRAFEANAVDYLMKPVSDHRLAECLQRARRRLAELRSADRSRAVTRLLTANPAPSVEQVRKALDGEARRLVVNDSGRQTAVEQADIVAIRAAGDYMCIATLHGEVVSRTTMIRVLSVLGEQFVRIHRSTTVNRDHVVTIVSLGRGRYDVVMRNDMRLSSSKRFRGSVRNLLRHLRG